MCTFHQGEIANSLFYLAHSPLRYIYKHSHSHKQRERERERERPYHKVYAVLVSERVGRLGAGNGVDGSEDALLQSLLPTNDVRSLHVTSAHTHTTHTQYTHTHTHTGEKREREEKAGEAEE
jgi:hypothetical protein